MTATTGNGIEDVIPEDDYIGLVEVLLRHPLNRYGRRMALYYRSVGIPAATVAKQLSDINGDAPYNPT